jgi:predicted  nucleic acid-binding Zn-ribbon protein
MNEKAKQTAARVANRLNGNSNDEVTSLRENIAQLNSRIQQLESQINPQPATRNPQLQHPSLDKFNVAEAVVEELVSFFEAEKSCMFEPDKSCDKCSMCSSRGF